MVEVFKTNVQEATEAQSIVAMLLQHFPDSKINFDLHDCDKVLRMEGEDFENKKVVSLVTQKGFTCTLLE
ncbi:MAG: hypothetical protein ACTHOF_13080 [Flavisolibacter sp.]|jgi:hypothetical protein